jgi:hypothetical protein
MFIVRFLNNGYLATGGLLNLVLGLRVSGFSKKTQARVDIPEHANIGIVRTVG